MAHCEKQITGLKLKGRHTKHEGGYILINYTNAAIKPGDELVVLRKVVGIRKSTGSVPAAE